MESHDGALSSVANGGGEVLGSVTHRLDCEGGVQLRTSARVSKKLKLDSLAQAVDKKDASQEDDKKVGAEGAGAGTGPGPGVGETKPRAKRVDWSPEDKSAFFEALNEYGKDIDAIHVHLTQKAKRRGSAAHTPQDMKTKDQVRFFYYRMWAILSKHITFPSYIKKQTQELYALINFGELRKKVSLSNKRHYEKLSEMIYSGSTRIKCRGKVRKVRTPLCKALRRLNQIEESSEELRLPSSVCVELRPRTNEAWCRVQAQAQNPRVRSLLPLHRRLESLVAHLAHRWRPPDDRLRGQLLEEGKDEGGSAPAAPTTTATPSCPVLRVGPRQGASAAKPAVALSEVASSSKLSLAAYERRFHPSVAPPQVPALLQQLPMLHRVKGRGVKRARADSMSAKEGAAAAAVAGAGVGGAGAEERADGGGGAGDGEQPAQVAPQAPLAIDCFTDDCAQQPSAEREPKASPDAGAKPTSPVKEGCTANVAEGAAGGGAGEGGWTQASAGPLRIGDVYMMYGSDGRVQLDYWWEEAGEGSAGSPTPVPCPDSQQRQQLTSLAASLSKLLAIAKLQAYRAKAGSSCYVGGNDLKAIAPKVRIHKGKSLPDTSQDTQLKLQSCPLPLDEVFRRPIVAPVTVVRPNVADDMAAASAMPFDKMRPRWCNRRGRPKWGGGGSGVTQRPPPPLLPKASPSPPPPKRRAGFTPIAPRPPPASPVPSPVAPQPVLPAPITIVADVKVAPVAGAGVNAPPASPGAGAGAGGDRAPSPPSLSNLLDDLSLPSMSGGSSRLSTPTFEGFLSSREGGVNLTSPSTSKDQWISQDAGADMSLSGLSTFLNTLDTDMKNITDDMRISQDSQLRNLMSTDMCTDLTDIIADLTENIKTETKPD